MLAEERETVVTVTDADELVTVWSAIRRHITRMRNDPYFTEVESGTTDGAEWARFTIPSESWSPTGVIRKRRLSEEQRTQRARQVGSLNSARQDTDEV